MADFTVQDFAGKRFIDSAGLEALIGAIKNTLNGINGSAGDLGGRVGVLETKVGELSSPTLSNNIVSAGDKTIKITYAAGDGISSDTTLDLSSMFAEFLTTDRFLDNVTVVDSTKLKFTFKVTNKAGTESSDTKEITVDLKELVNLYTTEVGDAAKDYFTLTVDANEKITLNVDTKFIALCTEVTNLRSELNTAKSDITGLGTRLGTAESNINTNLQAITQINGDITNLTTRVTTNEGNIGTLKDSVDSIQIMSATEVAALWNN